MGVIFTSLLGFEAVKIKAGDKAPFSSGECEGLIAE